MPSLAIIESQSLRSASGVLKTIFTKKSLKSERVDNRNINDSGDFSIKYNSSENLRTLINVENC